MNNREKKYENDRIRGAKSKRSYQAFKCVLQRIDSKFYQRILSSPRGERTLFPQLYIDSRRKRGVIFQSAAVIFQSKCRKDFRGGRRITRIDIDIIILSRLPHCIPILFFLGHLLHHQIDQIEFQQCGRAKDENPWKETRREEDIYFIFSHLPLPRSKLRLSCQRGCPLSLLAMGSSCVWIKLEQMIEIHIFAHSLHTRFECVLKLFITFFIFPCYNTFLIL